jgi:hypothetical protein
VKLERRNSEEAGAIARALANLPIKFLQSALVQYNLNSTRHIEILSLPMIGSQLCNSKSTCKQQHVGKNSGVLSQLIPQ